MQNSLPRRRYDFRIREAICESREPNTRRLRLLLPELNIPNSTIRSWFHRGIPDVVTSELVGDDQTQSLTENRELRRRIAILGAVVGVLVALLRLAKARFDFERIPESDSKRALLRAIERSKKGAPLHAVLRVAGR
jgi:hypothetical protein